jgi:hypothetical protein
MFPPLPFLTMKAHSYEHLRCTETVEDRDSGAGVDDSQSESFDDTYHQLSTTKPFYLGASEYTSISTDAKTHTILTHNGVQLLPSLPSDMPHHSIPLTAANLVSFDAPPTDQDYTLHNSLSTNTRGTTEYVWFCCNCGEGPNSCRIDANCPYCHNHPRSNACCRVEKIVRKK